MEMRPVDDPPRGHGGSCVNGGIEIVNLAAEGFAYRAGMN